MWYKEREVSSMTKVSVYFNLHRKLWSIRAEEGPYKGKVIAHAANVSLVEATPHVSEAGRLRVLEEKRKNVHACIKGLLEAHNTDKLDCWTDGYSDAGKISYNPYKASHFFFDDGEGDYAEWKGIMSDVLMSPKGVKEI